MLNEYDKAPSTVEKGTIIPFSLDFLKGNTENQPLFLLVDTNEYVPLELSETPVGIPQEDKRLNLLLTLTEDAKQLLAAFTTKHLNKKVAIVFGGKGVTKHKVKSVKEGGKL